MIRDQSLTMTSVSAVRKVLESSDSRQVVYFLSLIDTGKIGPYHSKNRSVTRRRFGESASDFAQLGKKLAPFDVGKAPPLGELQQSWLRELAAIRGRPDGSGNVTGGSASWGEAGDAMVPTVQDPDVQLINNLTNMSMTATGAITSFRSATLELLCQETDSTEPEHLLHAGTMSSTISSNDALLPLQHSNEVSTTTTLISGSLAWVIWPPTPHNSQVLTSAYECFNRYLTPATLEITDDLEGGIVLTQGVGEALSIRPVCPMMRMSTRPSVLATYSTVTAENLVSMLSNSALLTACFNTEIRCA